MEKLLENVMNELISKGIGTDVKPSSDGAMISFKSVGYNVILSRAKKETLFYYDSTKKTDDERRDYFMILQFIVPADKKPKVVFYLHNNSNVDEIVDWVKEKSSNPVFDKELEETCTKILDAVKSLKLDFLDKGRNTAISGEFEEYKAERLRSVLLCYNEIVGEDYICYEVRRNLALPGNPIILNMRCIDSTNNRVEDDIFQIEDVAQLTKRQIIMKCMDLSEKVKKGSKDETELQRRLNI